MLDLSELFRLMVWWLPNRKYAPPPGSAQRITRGEKIQLNCPSCKMPQPATEYMVERQSVHSHRWTHYYRAYECDVCDAIYNIESCTDGGAGIFNVNPWECPLCQHCNDPLLRQCKNCGAGDDSAN